MMEKQNLAAAVQELAWELARRQETGARRMEVTSPWEPGLSQEQRRQAWLATLAALEAVRAEVSRQTASAVEQAVQYGAGQAEIAEAAGRQRARRRWPRLFGRGGGRAGRRGETGAGLGTLSAHGRAASSRLDNLPPV
jgi:alkylhydroperoxidase/carboxymuconolactone decarboxylase family protein YurZ